MRRVLLMLACLTIAPPLSGQSPFDGSWVTHTFAGAAPSVIDLSAASGRVSGTISRGTTVFEIHDGAVSGSTVTFKVTSAAGDRTNTYTGTLDGDQLQFTRSVQVRPGGNGTGAGIFGGTGPMEFVAVRDDVSGLVVPRALFGSWRADTRRFTQTVGPHGVVWEQFSFANRTGGTFDFVNVWALVEGNAVARIASLKADGREYPIYASAAVATLIDEGDQPGTTIAMRPVNERMLEVTYRNAGVVTGTSRLSVSPDGRTLTEAGRTLNALGEEVNSYSWTYERVLPAAPPT
jgi:hypothetical protein